MKQDRKERTEDRYERLEDKLEEVAMDSHRTQSTTKAEIISESSNAVDCEEVRPVEAEGGEVNRGFIKDEKKTRDDDSDVAAFITVVEQEEAVIPASLHLNNNTTLVVANVTPKPTDAEPAFTPSPAEYDDPPPPRGGGGHSDTSWLPTRVHQPLK